MGVVTITAAPPVIDGHRSDVWFRYALDSYKVVPFTFGDHVMIDGDRSIKATVTAFTFAGDGPAYVEVSWIQDGKSVNAKIEDYRLERWA